MYYVLNYEKLQFSLSLESLRNGQFINEPVFFEDPYIYFLYTTFILILMLV